MKKDCENEVSGVRTKRLRKETTTGLAGQIDPSTSVILLPELALSIGTSAAKSLKFPAPTTCTSYCAPADSIHGLADNSPENVSFFASPSPPSLLLTSTPIAKDNTSFRSSNPDTFSSVNVTKV